MTESRSSAVRFVRCGTPTEEEDFFVDSVLSLDSPSASSSNTTLARQSTSYTAGMSARDMALRSAATSETRGATLVDTSKLETTNRVSVSPTEILNPLPRYFAAADVSSG